MEELIRLTGVTKQYKQGTRTVRALDGVDLSVRRGEFTAIVGESGSGKSTLLNILGCLDVPTAGSYRLDGTDVLSCTERELTLLRGREIGFVFQGFHLVPALTALENVELPLLYRGLGRTERKELAASALERVGLSRRLRHRPNEMSGGQQQRVAIARAIAARPSLLLADEPTGNLDRVSGSVVMKILKELHAEGKTVLLITHDPSVAARAERVCTMKDGRLREGNF